MSKKNKVSFDDFDGLDDYFEEEGDDNFFNMVVENDYSDVGYDDFNKINDIKDDDEEDENIPEKKENAASHNSSEFIGYLSIFWTWFRRLGIAIAIILSAYYITKGRFSDLFLYFLLLVGAFFFGFGFMFLINKVMDNR